MLVKFQIVYKLYQDQCELDDRQVFLVSIEYNAGNQRLKITQTENTVCNFSNDKKHFIFV